MFGWLRVRFLLVMFTGLMLWISWQSPLPVQATGKAVPKIAFVIYDKTTYTSTLNIADPDGKNVVTLFKDGNFFSPAWSPDGTQLAFTGSPAHFSGSSELYLVNSDGSNVRKLSAHSSTRGAGRVVWSPDGTQLTYTVYAGEDITAYRINMDGSGETKLTFKDLPYGLASTWITWSADGKQMSVLGNLDSSDFAIYLTDQDGKNAKPLPALLPVKTGISFDLVWSPDKQHLFVSEVAGNGESRQLYVANNDGSNPKVILKSPKLPAAYSLSISPDGKQLLFIGGAPEGMKQSALWVANVDGSGLHALPLRAELSSTAGTSWGMVPQDKLPKGKAISFPDVVQ